MKKIALAVLVLFVAVAFVAMGPDHFVCPAERRSRSSVKTSASRNGRTKSARPPHKTFNWRMSDPWGGNIFHDMAMHFADTVRACSGGRLNIKVFPTGAIVPAMEIFEATSKGTLDAFHSWPGYWKGRNEAFVAYASVPFGLDNEGYNIWYYERGGKAMFDELYGRFGLMPFFCGNVGMEIGMHSNKRATKLEDFKGMKVRTVGWYMDILTRMGVSVTPLPGPEIYLALERGVIDAVEFSSPAANVPDRVPRDHQVRHHARRAPALLPVRRRLQQEEMRRAARGPEDHRRDRRQGDPAVGQRLAGEPRTSKR